MCWCKHLRNEELSAHVTRALNVELRFFLPLNASALVIVHSSPCLVFLQELRCLKKVSTALPRDFKAPVRLAHARRWQLLTFLSLNPLASLICPPRYYRIAVDAGEMSQCVPLALNSIRFRRLSRLRSAFNHRFRTTAPLKSRLWLDVFYTRSF